MSLSPSSPLLSRLLAGGFVLAAGAVLTGCGAAPEPAPAQESPAATEESAEATPAEEQEAAAGPIAVPADCEQAGTETAVAAHITDDMIFEEQGAEGQLSCLWVGVDLGSGEMSTIGVDYTSSGPNLAEIEGVVDGDEVYTLPEVEELGGVLQKVQVEDLGGSTVSLHLPDGPVITAVSVFTPLETAELEAIVIAAAGQLR
ncbi:hypothetical protein GCM10027294_18230 [Marinactinospora endophytica]